MKSNNYTNKFCIIAKHQEVDHWDTVIPCIETPATLTFAISSMQPDITIKKILWDFGKRNIPKSLTNRKQELNMFGVHCKYRKSHDTTITIQASVYTDTNMFIPIPIETVTINHVIKEHYVDPEVFKQQILEYYKTGIFSNEVGSSIYKIANRTAFAPNFINYTYREEMVGDAVIRMIEALSSRKYDPAKGNPFSYYTKITINAFKNRLKKEKKARIAITNYQNDVYEEMRNEGLLPYNRHDASIDYNGENKDD
jgi:hypothetical protein